MPAVVHNDDSDPDPIDYLKRWRLANDISYERLAAMMEKARYPVRTRSLHLALTGRLRGGPSERTRFKIERFVVWLKKRMASKREAAAKGVRA